MPDHNHNAPEIPIPRSVFPMEEFDKLPPIVRQALANHPYKVHPNKESIDYIRKDGGKSFVENIAGETRRVVRDAALDAYGPDHPQAK